VIFIRGVAPPHDAQRAATARPSGHPAARTSASSRSHRTVAKLAREKSPRASDSCGCPPLPARAEVKGEKRQNLQTWVFLFVFLPINGVHWKCAKRARLFEGRGSLRPSFVPFRTSSERTELEGCFFAHFLCVKESGSPAGARPGEVELFIAFSLLLNMKIKRNNGINN